MNEVDPVVAHRLRCDWFASIQELSDQKLQKRTWLDLTNTNPHWSYVEFCASYPDESQLHTAYAGRWLTASEFEILSELGRAIEAHSAPKGDSFDHAAILEDPAWHDVIEMAELARQRLLAIVTVGEEREALRATPSPSLSP